jgi:hypothetical protein
MEKEVSIKTSMKRKVLIKANMKKETQIEKMMELLLKRIIIRSKSGRIQMTDITIIDE